MPDDKALQIDLLRLRLARLDMRRGLHDDDPEAAAEIERRRAELDAELARIRSGDARELPNERLTPG